VEKHEILPPGQHAHDPVKQDIDPIAFALERVQTFLIWIDEHRSSFEKVRATDPDSADRELSNLRNSTKQAMAHLQRLSEFILEGHTIDPGKRLPKGLSKAGTFSSYVLRLLAAEEGKK
jgi:hypothetical protein